MFNGVQATNMFFLNDGIETVIPDGATSGQLVVYNLNGLSSNPVDFTVVPEPSSALLVLIGGTLIFFVKRSRKNRVGT